MGKKKKCKSAKTLPREKCCPLILKCVQQNLKEKQASLVTCRVKGAENTGKTGCWSRTKWETQQPQGNVLWWKKYGRVNAFLTQVFQTVIAINEMSED